MFEEIIYEETKHKQHSPKAKAKPYLSFNQSKIFESYGLDPLPLVAKEALIIF